MGMCQSAEVAHQRKVNSKIDKNIANDKHEEQSHVKLLLLGAAECGKSTVLKQMKILHSEGFSDLERKTCRMTIYESMLQDMTTLMDAAKALRIEVQPADNAAIDTQGRLIRKHLDMAQFDGLSADCADALRLLWSCMAIQQCYKRRNEFQLNDSCKYFFNEIDRVAVSTYSPSTQDILNMRLPTLGIHETRFNNDGTLYRVFDVGGQRSERRKWIHCFDDVHGIIFIVAVSEFDQVLKEDGKTNRLLEAVVLYTSILNTPWFTKTSIILFLNKCDLFTEKIANGGSIVTAFPDYKDENTVPASMDYLSAKLVALGRQNTGSSQRGMYTHQTCATDTDQVSKVLKDVIDVVSTQLIKDTGL